MSLNDDKQKMNLESAAATAAEEAKKPSRKSSLRRFAERYREMDASDKKRWWREFLINNSLYFFIIIAVIYIQFKNHNFLSLGSVISIISLTAASLPIALGIAGTIVLTGTDLSAGRVVGLSAAVAASLSQPLDYAVKMFKGMNPLPIPAVLLICIAIGAAVGLVNGFSVAKFSLHPFIVTLATQLIVYGLLLVYMNMGTNNGQAIGGIKKAYTDLVKGSILKIGDSPIPNYVFFALGMVALMWLVWNKTAFGKNMFAVGSNPQAAAVSGVNVAGTIILVFVIAGACYGLTGFVESARISSNTPNTGLNYELDAIAACVIGGVSFVGGIGKISGVVIGVLLLRLIFTGLLALGINMNLQYIIKGLIILVACAIDMRKYLVRK